MQGILAAPRVLARMIGLTIGLEFRGHLRGGPVKHSDLPGEVIVPMCHRQRAAIARHRPVVAKAARTREPRSTRMSAFATILSAMWIS